MTPPDTALADGLRAMQQKLITPEVVYFPVRHHSPACAWQIRQWIRAHRPRAVLVEGPDDFMPLVPHLLHEKCRPPVAIYTHYRIRRPGSKNKQSSEGRHAAYYPLCEYSPEWVALREGHAVGATLRFIDLDYPSQRVVEDAAQEKPGALKIESLQAEHHFRRSAYLQELARRLGCRDHDELWDHLIEVRGWQGEPEKLMHDVAAYCWFSRLDCPPEVMEADGTLAREAAMATAIREVLGQPTEGPAAGPVLVVTGGFHTVVLPDLVNALTVSPAPRHEPQERHSCLTRYTFNQLDSLSGYGAGMPQPGYYQACWEALSSSEDKPLDAVALRMIVELGRTARSRDLAGTVSAADEIAALAQTQGLAQLRGHPGPSREDVWDGLRGAMVKGEMGADGGALMALARQIFTGRATGDVPPDAGVPPLVEDFRQTAKQARLPVEYAATEGVALEIYKKEAHRTVSRFLHQLEYLQVPFGTRKAGPDFVNGTNLRRIVEHWDCQWAPHTEAMLIERSVYGSSVREAATSRLAEAVTQLESASSPGTGEGVSLLIRACLMGLPDAATSLALHLVKWIASDPSFSSVAEGLGQLLLLWQSREPLEARKLDLLPALVKSGYQRACQLLEQASLLPEEQAEPVVRACLMLRSRLAAQGDDEGAEAGSDEDQGAGHLDAAPFWEALRRVQHHAQCAPLLRGAAAGLLHTAGRMDLESLLALTRGNLAPAVGESARQIAFLTGLLKAARELAWREPRLLAEVEGLMSHWSDDEFLRRLPDLRLAWADLTPRETDRVAALVAEHNGVASLPLPRYAGVTEAELLAALQASSVVEKALREDGLATWLQVNDPQPLPEAANT
ncbi:DUF5682 family protein [Verrucomicrobium sp. BvORR034]|uniref:DUF5682 family protein n=1 Tax=Verrucomicrobium sp. BvORR034 TaxID=1396418 RepID=UPI0006786B64|nr:DUF5682 family protein [Verrucomicrobium sp. BvORR034]